jgi:hypothetical protein
MFATLVTLVLHLLNCKWSYDPAPLATVDSDSELEVFLEIIGSAVCQEFLILLTGRVTPTAVLQRLLGHYDAKVVFMVIALISVLFINYRRQIALIVSNPASRLRKFAVLGCVVLVVSYCVSIALLQVFVDVEEIANIRLGWVYPWNYRWQVPNPFWWML